MNPNIVLLTPLIPFRKDYAMKTTIYFVESYKEIIYYSFRGGKL